MQTFVDAPGLITDYKYDHVAIATSGIERGITGSIASPIVCDEPQHFITSIDLSDNPLLQDKQRVHIFLCLLLLARPYTHILCIHCNTDNVLIPVSLC